MLIGWGKQGLCGGELITKETTKDIRWISPLTLSDFVGVNKLITYEMVGHMKALKNTRK